MAQLIVGKKITFNFLEKYLGSDPFTVPTHIVFNGSFLTTDALANTGANGYNDRTCDMAFIGSIGLMKAKDRDAHLGCTSIHELDKLLERRHEEAQATLTPEELLPQDDEASRQRVRSEVPPEYHDLPGVFSKVESDQLPPLRSGVDHRIKLDPGTDPKDLKYSPLYKMSLEELEACKAYLKENLYKCRGT